MNKTVYILLCLLISGCFGYKTPALQNKDDILRLSEDTSWIRGRSLTDDDIVYLKRFRRAFNIELGSSGESYITDMGLKTLSELDLTFVVCYVEYNSNITDKGIKYLSSISSQRRIGLKANSQLTNKSIEYLAQMEKLRELDIRGCPGITDKGLEILAQKKGLSELSIGAVCISPQFRKKVAKTNMNIENLANSITAKGIINLAQNPSLEVLYIQANQSNFFSDEVKERIQDAFSGSDCSIMIVECSEDMWNSQGYFRNKWQQIHGKPVNSFPLYF
jgi:hypothetical protein